MEASIQSCCRHSQRFCRWRTLVNILFIRINKKVQSKTWCWCFYQWHISRTCINNCYLCNMSAVGGVSYWMDWWNDLFLWYITFSQIRNSFVKFSESLWSIEFRKETCRSSTFGSLLTRKSRKTWRFCIATEKKSWEYYSNRFP